MGRHRRGRHRARRGHHLCPNCALTGARTWVRGKDSTQWCDGCEAGWTWFGPSPVWRSTTQP